MKHINFKLTKFPFVPLFEDNNPLPPPTPILLAAENDDEFITEGGDNLVAN